MTSLACRALAAALVLATSPLTPAGARAATLEEHLEALLVQPPRQPIPAPAFTLEGLHGSPQTLEGLRGKVVFLNFWATWCVPCRAEMPAIERLHRAYRDRGLSVVAVNVKESKGQAEAFMKELQLTFPIVLDADGAVSRRFAARGLPVSFLLDREGKILWKALGAREWDGPHGRAYLDLMLPPPRR